MKIWVHPYHLGDRLGALLKVEWAVHQTGYSDLHPWPEFGEAPLDQHIESLASVDFTKLAEVSMEFNYIDREFRLHKRNAFLGMILPRSHRLVKNIETVGANELSAWQEAGFTHLKVKITKEGLKEQTAAFAQVAYATNMMWRLDFNGRLTGAEFSQWWEALDPALKARVDFVEDPASDEELRVSGPWADDWFRNKNSKVRIVKPAREAAEELMLYDRVIFTHSLDHPLGRACAAWSAAHFYAEHPKMMEVCGLASADPIVADSEGFHEQWNCEGPRLKPTLGTGFGFDEILESLKWERIL